MFEQADDPGKELVGQVLALKKAEGTRDDQRSSVFEQDQHLGQGLVEQVRCLPDAQRTQHDQRIAVSSRPTTRAVRT